jgi:LPPG:FO 2-phospho-L-lactate transferase
LGLTGELAGTPVVVLAGGTGGAKLARGLLDVIGGEALTVIANTGDDIEIYGAHVSPDPDLVAFWLADRIDERGWGLEGDTFSVMDGLRELGGDVWFNLGDRDLAWCLERRRMLERGLRPTEAMGRLVASIGVAARVLPMSDDPVRTWVKAHGEWHSFQEFMIRRRAAGPVEQLDLRGAQSARPSAEVLAALGNARAIVIGPSNPAVSIGPILALTGLREALARAAAPVVAVSPIVGGEVLKGPTAEFMRHAGHEVSAAGVADHYAGLLDGLVCDEPLEPDADQPRPVVLRTDTRMDSPEARRRLAEETLSFALALA